MTMRAVVLIGLVGLQLAAGSARADPPAAAPVATPVAMPEPPDPSAVEAGDANLAPIGDRHGVTFAASAGGGFLVGFGIANSVGRGGAVSLRLGHVATPHTVISFALDVAVTLHQPAKSSPIATNTYANLVAGAQYYVNRSLWLRFAGGLGRYDAHQVKVPGGMLGDHTVLGPAVLAGLGIDILRFKRVVLGLEFTGSAMISGEGVLIANSAALGLTVD